MPPLVSRNCSNRLPADRSLRQMKNQLLWIAVAHIPQVQHLVAQFVLKEVIESVVDRCEPGDEVLFGSSGDRRKLNFYTLRCTRPMLPRA